MQGLVGRLRIEAAGLGAGERFRSAVVRMQPSARHAFAHSHAEDAVEPKAIAELVAHHGHRQGMVHQIDERLPPAQKAGIGFVRAAGHAETIGAVGPARIVGVFFRHRRQTFVEDAVQRCHLIFVEHVLNHDVALQVVQVVAQFLRFVHLFRFTHLLRFAHAILPALYSPNTHNTPPWGTIKSVWPSSRKASCWRSASTPQPDNTAMYCLPPTA